MPNFHQDLPFGEEAERQFLKAYSPWIVKYKDHKADFRQAHTRNLIELKSDKTLYKAHNFYFEHENLDNGKLGGPYRAAGDGVRFFCYWFTKRGEWYLFDSQKLVERLDSIPNKREDTQNNGSFTTKGYIVPVEQVLDLAQRFPLVFEESRDD